MIDKQKLLDFVMNSTNRAIENCQPGLSEGFERLKQSNELGEPEVVALACTLALAARDEIIDYINGAD